MNAEKLTISDDISDTVPDGRVVIWAIRIAVQHVARILGRRIEHAARHSAAFVRKQFIRYALLNVVGFAGEHRQRLVLRLPAEARDGAVVAAGIETAANAKLRSRGLRGRQVSQQRGIRRVLHQSQSEK